MEQQQNAQLDISGLLIMMKQRGASDLFISADVPPSVKVDGKLTPLVNVTLTEDDSRNLAYSLMNEQNRRDFEDTNECNFAVFPKEIGRFRVNVFVQQGKVGMVLRTIEMEIPTIESLHLPDVLKDIVMSKRGMVIFVGATGSGKSTSIASMLGYANDNRYGHILTIEDPVEFVHQSKNCLITQREVGVDTESFTVGLQNAMRQAPDIILIGEIRSQETMDHAVVFSETGHLCMATLHANNSNQALDRIINFFPEDRRDQLLMDLSLNLRAIISQRLIPRKN
ncbi:MAG: type IV pili twitching motility protein PilT, partial [Gammaproteobacteria bacterium]